MGNPLAEKARYLEDYIFRFETLEEKGGVMSGILYKRQKCNISGKAHESSRNNLTSIPLHRVFNCTAFFLSLEIHQ